MKITALVFFLSFLTNVCLQAAAREEVLVPGRKVLSKKFGCRHENLRVVVCHPTKNLFVSGSLDGSIKVWEYDEESLNCVAIFNERQNEPLQGIRSLAIHAGKNLLASASQDATVKVWDLETLQCTQILEVEDCSFSLFAFDRSGELLACAGGNYIYFWTTADATSSGKWTRFKFLSQPTDDDDILITDVLFGPKSNTLLFSWGDWDECTGTIELKHCNESFESIESIGSFDSNKNSAPIRLAVDQNELKCVAGYHDSSVAIWDLQKRVFVATFQAHTSQVSTFALHPRGRYLVTCDAIPGLTLSSPNMCDGRLKVWDLTTTELIAEYDAQEYFEVISASFNGDGSLLVTGDNAGNIYISQFMGSYSLKEMCAVAMRCNAGTQSADEHFTLEQKKGNTLFSDGKKLLNKDELENMEIVFSSISQVDVSRAYAKTRAYRKRERLLNTDEDDDGDRPNKRRKRN